MSMRPPKGSACCDVAIVGAGLAGLYAARLLTAAGLDVLVLEAQRRVGGRTLTQALGGAAFVDHGGQWISPGQDRIRRLARELGIALFPSWGDGLMVNWRGGTRTTSSGPLLEMGTPAQELLTRAARTLARMAEEIDVKAPWKSPHAAEWDRMTLHDWLSRNVANPIAQRILSNAIEGVFVRNAVATSLLAALFWIRSGDPLVPLLATEDPVPEFRVVGGAQQFCQKLADALGSRVLLGAAVREVDQSNGIVEIRTGDCSVRARRAIVAVPPAVAACIAFRPSLPGRRVHLGQRTPMRWVTKIHCLYSERFWADEGLSGSVMSDEGAVRITADNSPPAGVPGILVGFIEETESVKPGCATLEERRAAVVSDLARYFGERTRDPIAYYEYAWGEDRFCQGADGGYWTTGVWTTYGPALREPVDLLHWAGTESSAVWNGKMEGALLSAERVANEIQGAIAHSGANARASDKRFRSAV
jgi:monoamine oxidase